MKKINFQAALNMDRNFYNGRAITLRKGLNKSLSFSDYSARDKNLNSCIGKHA